MNIFLATNGEDFAQLTPLPVPASWGPAIGASTGADFVLHRRRIFIAALATAW